MLPYVETLSIDHNPGALYSHPLSFFFSCSVDTLIVYPICILLVSFSSSSSSVVGRVGYALVEDLSLFGFAPRPLGSLALSTVSFSDLFISFFVL